MSVNNEETPPAAPLFDFDAYPEDTLFHDRRGGRDRRRSSSSSSSSGSTAGRPVADPTSGTPPPERRARKERRRRVDPTTFEKQYTCDEMEFMNAMQRFKVQTGKAFPSHGDVLRVAASLGYRRLDPDAPEGGPDTPPDAVNSDDAPPTGRD